ncbi:MAG: adenylate kinase family protein [Natrialbaceae archaeon]|nr:adenylate kinase family protein [Natrialbaceae archaeon]
MRVGITGTPGTGKSTVADVLEDRTSLEVVHLGERLADEDLVTGQDADRGSVIADIDALAARVETWDDVIVESHLVHHLPVDRVVVLRCAPAELERRLGERGVTEASIQENAESEALDVILAEAVDQHGRESVYEIDTTNLRPNAVADAIEAVLEGRRDPSAGTVDFIEYLA